MRTPKSPGDRLISIILKYPGTATLRRIARCHLVDADLERALRETEGMIVFESTFQNGPGRRSKTARLTQKGLWRAIQLAPAYNEDLVLSVLAATEIKALLGRLEAEGNPLAVQISRDRDDAQEYRRQLAARKEAKTLKEKEALAKPKRKRTLRDREHLNRFLESRGLPLAKLPPATQSKPQPARHSPWANGFRQPALPAPATPTPEPKREEAVDARKAELKRHCVICSTDGIEIEHDCSRFQVA